MLQAMRRGGGTAMRQLPIEEDEGLRAAFGRYGRVAARPAAAAIVGQHHAVGRWFVCDCLGDVDYPPVLVPVLGTHVRRHVEGQWPEHAAWCDFYREPAEQVSVSQSYRAPKDGIRLVRAFATPQPLAERSLRFHGREERRSRLVRLLFQLLEAAGQTQVRSGETRTLTQQFHALKEAAKAIEVDDMMPLSSVLCTFRPALEEHMDRIARIPTGAFRRSGNPHGVFIGFARSARHGVIEPVQGDPIPVVGEIAIFGEQDGQEARAVAAGERSPYVMACLVGRRQPDGPVEVLRAYLHPCMSSRWLFPVDSNRERQTMFQLRGLGRWFAERHSVTLTVRKPVHDLSPEAVMAPGQAAEPHELVIPDFIVERDAGRRIVVETMGYDSEVYRQRKARMHREMSRLCGGAPVIEHDFCRPAAMQQRDRDDQFWLACRSALLARRLP